MCCRPRDAPGARARQQADALLLGHALVRAARLGQHRARQTPAQAAQCVRYLLGAAASAYSRELFSTKYVQLFVQSSY